MQASRSTHAGLRTHAGLLLHAAGVAALFVGGRWGQRFDDQALVMAPLFIASSLALAHAPLQRALAVALPLLLLAVAFLTAWPMTAAASFYAALFCAPALALAAGTRERWAWARVAASALGLVALVAFDHAVDRAFEQARPAALVPVALASHLLLRAACGAPAAAMRARWTVALAVGACVALAVGVAGDTRSTDETLRALRIALLGVPLLPAATALATSVGLARAAPRLGLDGGAVVALAAYAVARPRLAGWDWEGPVVLVAAGLAMATTAGRPGPVRALAVLVAAAALALSRAGTWFDAASPAGFAVCVGVALVASFGLGAPHSRARPEGAGRTLDVDEGRARAAALLQTFGLALTAFFPAASLLAIAPAIALPRAPLPRLLALVVVALAWITTVTTSSGFHAEARLAWVPWLALAVVDAVRARGDAALVARLALLAGCAALASWGQGAWPLLLAAAASQAAYERALGVLRPLPHVEAVAVLAGAGVLAAVPVFTFAMRWLVSPDGIWPYWELHPVSLFIIDGPLPLVALALVVRAGVRRGLPALGPGGAWLVAVATCALFPDRSLAHEAAALAVALFALDSATLWRESGARAWALRGAGVACAALAFAAAWADRGFVVPIAALAAYPVWAVVWFACIALALVAAGAFRVALRVEARAPALAPALASAPARVAALAVALGVVSGGCAPERTVDDVIGGAGDGEGEAEGEGGGEGGGEGEGEGGGEGEGSGEGEGEGEGEGPRPDAGFLEPLCPPDDAFEPNDVNAPAVIAVGATDAVMCGLDDDCYRLPVAVGCMADVRVASDAPAALALLDVDGAELQRAEGPAPRIAQGVRDDGLRVLVSGSTASGPGAAFRYVLRADAICRDNVDCTNDPVAFGDAVPLGANDLAVSIVCIDDDFFTVPLTAGCTVHAQLELEHDEGDLALELLGDTSGVTLASSDTASDVEALSFFSAVDDAALLRVSVQGLFSGPYRLTVTTTCE